MVSFLKLGNYLSIGLVISLNAILLVGAKPKLKLINVIFRHGDRTPDNNGYEMYPNDPHLNNSFFPEGLGQLTNRGKLREYELGAALRNKYKDFLGDLYLPKIVMGRSSDYDRTKMSLQLVLAALFPPNARQRWNSDLNWQPIPTTYISRIEDNFFLADECPQYLNEYDRVLDLPETKERMSQFKNMSTELTKSTGKKIEKPLDMFYLYHTFVSESFMNLTLPEWANTYFPNGQLLEGIIAAYDIGNSSPLLRRLYAGPIIRAMSENMQAVKNGILSTKIYLYSGHETNVATMLHAFNVYTPHVPEYSSAVILELLKEDDQYYVKLLHYKGIPSVIEELTISGCERLCPFNTFTDLTQNLIPSDEEMVCDKRQTPDYANA